MKDEIMRINIKGDGNCKNCGHPVYKSRAYGRIVHAPTHFWQSFDIEKIAREAQSGIHDCWVKECICITPELEDTELPAIDMSPQSSNQKPKEKMKKYGKRKRNTK